MKINKKTLLWFLLCSFLSVFIWIKFSYPQLTFVKLSVDRQNALNIAKAYLRKDLKLDVSSYRSAVTFETDNSTNRYLQKTIGFYSLSRFIKNNSIDMFYWNIRFFKINSKEEFWIAVSSSTKEIIGYRHIIDDNEARKKISREEAIKKAKQFLISRFNFNSEEYYIRTDSQRKFDNRINYSFSWCKKSVSIPWDKDINKGTGKLEIAVTVSGNEILSFDKNVFIIPDQFKRQMKKSLSLGRNLSDIIRIFFFFLLFVSIYYVIARRNHLSMHVTKRFYITVASISFLLSLLSTFNYLEGILSRYDTSTTLSSYIFSLSVNTLITSFFLSLLILTPSLSGESFHYETLRKKKEGAFTHYIQSTFFSRQAAVRVVLGYLICVIMLGIQSILVKFGQKFLGVWVEYSLIALLSTAYLPFIAAFTVGFKASLTEELTFRLFTLSWGKKVFKSTIIVVIISSLIWGFAHSNYPVFPMWFRGVEVTILGIFLSFIYLRYGIITVIVAHFLFDVFWSSSGYLLGHSTPFYFYTSLFVMLIPLFYAAVAFIINKEETERPMKWRMNKHQLYNIEVLKTFLEQNNTSKDKTKNELKGELISHGWDAAVVDEALGQGTG